jgi:hypothetical protein
MRRAIKIILILILGLSPEISFCQDTATSTFKIIKLYATAGGLSNGTVDRNALSDSGGIVIHGCPDCRVLGFQLTGKLVQPKLPQKIINMDTSMRLVQDSDYTTGTLVQYNQGPMNEVFKSKSDLFTPVMKRFIENGDKEHGTYYVEISNIKIKTPEGEIKTLDKICLNLQ